MTNILRVLCVVVYSYVSLVQATCEVVQLSYVIQHAVWRGWNQAVIFTPQIEPGCQSTLLHMIKCLGVNGVASALHVRKKPINKERLGIILLTPKLNKNTVSILVKYVNHLYSWKLHNAGYDWLILTRSTHDYKYINKLLNTTELRFDQNIVVAYPDYRYQGLKFCEKNFSYKLGEKKGNNYFELTYYRQSQRFFEIARTLKYKRNGNDLNLLRSGIIQQLSTPRFEMYNISGVNLTHMQSKWNSSGINGISGINIVQYFKAKVNSTLYVAYLGKWNENISMSLVKNPYSVEARNILGEKIIVGRSNSSNEENYVLDENFTAAHELLDDILQFITIRMNATLLTRYYSKIGSRTYEGVWSGLLGALSDNSVDIAFEPIAEQALAGRRDVDFLFPIAETMCNIYMRNQETSAVRDIFLAPFSSRLFVCVIAVVIVTSITSVIICEITVQLSSNRRLRKMSYTEALVWSLGILCQQGGAWTPQSPSASILLVVCLFFAFITYNAYAAFITSVLSVRVANVETVADVLQTKEMKIGYIRNGPDQIYLMSTKDVQLNEFYIRGYSEAENLVISAEDGLSRAASQDYGFFAGQRVARTTLRSISQARGRCALRELPVPSTRSDLSFPLPHGSPYSKPILVSLLQLRSSGTLSRLAGALVPAMPQCSPPSGFTSARAVDVRTAYLVIAVGFILSIAIGFGEYTWKNRKKCKTALKEYYKRILNMFH